MASARPSQFIHPGTAALAAYRADKLQTTKAIVQHAVQTAGHDLKASETRALAKITHTNHETIKKLVEEAKQQFVGSIKDYVEIHKTATQEAYLMGDMETAIKASQWAMEKASVDGVRVIEQPKEAPVNTGTKILIGIRLGGQRDTVEGAPIEGELLEG